MARTGVIKRAKGKQVSIQSNERGAETVVFYDGTCGLCHGFVRFVLRRAPRGRDLRFAPLQGETFQNAVAPFWSGPIPDSLVVRTPEGRTWVRSGAVIQVLRRLGGPWAFLGGCLWAVPRPLRDLGYDLVARLRQRFFARPDGHCPRMSPEDRQRFLP